ncbi:hypothetical protein WDU94_010399 [Cyamophila willieti]
MAIVLCCISTFFLAIADMTELMMKLVEVIAMVQTFFEYILMRTNLSGVIGQINKMKDGFCTVNSNIVRRCKKEEMKYFITWVVMASFTNPFVQRSVERNLNRAEMYGYKYPENVVPINIYIPGNLIDLSAPPFYYIYMILMPFFAVEIVTVSVAAYTMLGMYSIHIRGQYEILHHYIKMTLEAKETHCRSFEILHKHCDWPIFHL